jgi:hypothetical protein
VPHLSHTHGQKDGGWGTWNHALKLADDGGFRATAAAKARAAVRRVEHIERMGDMEQWSRVGCVGGWHKNHRVGPAWRECVLEYAGRCTGG